MEKFNKKLLAVTRLVLFALGAILGWLIMYQFLQAYPDAARAQLKVVFMAASALVLALLFMLSAKPVMYLGQLLINWLKKSVVKHSPAQIAGVILGIVAGLMVAFLADALLRQVLHIVALRVLITVVVALVACFLCALACSRSLVSEEPEEVVEQSYSGFIIAYSAFYDEKILRLTDGWLEGKLFVLKKTVDRLIADLESDDAAKSALSRYHALTGCDALKTVENSSKLSEQEELIHTAQTKRLKIIAAGDEYDAFADTVKILRLDTL